jgi:transposase-like protein
MNKNRKSFELEYKRKIVSEYLEGKLSASAIAEREGIERFQIYSWKSQLEGRAKEDRIEELSEAGHNPDDIRRLMDLEEELAAAKAKIADLTLVNDLLKKLHPSFQSERKSSGFAELKRRVSLPKGRVK